MNDILAVILFLIGFTALMIVIYRIIGEDAKKVHGCAAGGMKLNEEKKPEDA